MFPIRKILFPVDFSKRDTAAAPMVETFTGHFQANLTILHVVEPLAYNDLPHAVNDVQRRIETYLADELKQLDVRRVLTRGDPADQITEYGHSGHFDLIMLPTHGHGRFRRFIIGSIAAKVLHDADCPVWTSVHVEKMPPLEDISFERVACAIDLQGSHSRAPLLWAMQFAGEVGAVLTVIHAVSTASESVIADASERMNGELICVEEELESMKDGGGPKTELAIAVGEVPRAVRQGVEKCRADMLVIGRSAEHGIIGRLRTHAYSIIRQSPCPVVSV